MASITKPSSAMAVTAAKAAKDWSLPRFWVSIPSYKKQLVKIFWGRILDLAWLKFDVAALSTMYLCSKKEFFNSYLFEEQGTFESSE